MNGIKFTPAQWINVVLIVEYLILAVAYGAEHHWPKTLYWIGAAIISVAILIS